MQRVSFENQSYYHVYNRGVDKRNIFLDESDYRRFLKSLREFNNSLSYFQRDFLERKGADVDLAGKKFDFRYLKSNFLPSLRNVSSPR